MSFSDIIDQEAAREILKNELMNLRISHAYLFIGQDGVGKKLLAFQFARALNCREVEGDSCDDCLSCRKIKHSNHPDVNLIEPEDGSDYIKIDQIRNLQKEIAFKPYESKWKVYIIEGADKMTTEAANSMLKTLEDPPAYAVLILLAEEQSRLLPTVISRCQQLTLRKISQDKIEKYLIKEGTDENRADLVAGLARGSLGRALALVEDEDFLNKRTQVLELAVKLPEMKAVQIFEKANELAGFMKSDLPLFDLLSNWYRDIMIYMQGNTDTIINQDYVQEIKEQAQEYTLEQVLSIIKMLTKHEKYLSQNVNKRLTIQSTLLKIRSKRV